MARFGYGPRMHGRARRASRRGPLAPLLAALSIAACAEPTRFVATEELGDADLRVVIARTDRVRSVQLLTRDQPFRFDAEPLSEVFARGDVLRVHVLGYTLASLRALFPTLAERSAAELSALLRPGIGPPRPGLHAAPPPTIALSADISRGNEEDVRYDELTLERLAGDPELAVVFEVDAALLCPPVGVSFRAFARDEPERVCIYQRDAACTWSRPDRGTCENAGAIFGAREVPAPTRIEQLPDGSLRLQPGSRTCRRVAPRDSGAVRGETAAWDCGGAIVAIQDAAVDAEGEPWAIERAARLVGLEPGARDAFAPATLGAFYAADGPDGARLRLLQAGDGTPSSSGLRHFLLDDSGRGAGRGSSADGLRVSFTGPLATAIGDASEQCLRILDDNRAPTRTAAIASRDGERELSLHPPGLGGPMPDLGRWDMVGDPGQTVSMTPRVAEVSLPPDLGGLVRLSSRPDATPQVLVVHGAARTFRLNQIARFPGDVLTYGCPLQLRRPEGLVGEIIAARNGYYALVEDGVVQLDARGELAAESRVAGLRLGPTARLFRGDTESGAGRALVWVPERGELFVFDPPSGAHHRLMLEGTLLAVLGGPRVLLRPQGTTHVVELLDVLDGPGGERITYLIPAVEEERSPAVEVEEAAVVEREGRQLIGWSSGRAIGLLELRTGRSTSLILDGPVRVRSLFREPTSTRTWIVADEEAPARGSSLFGAPRLDAR